MKKSEFERILMKMFRALDKHGFKRGETVYSQKGCTAQFLNTTTDITLHYEIGVEPWFDITEVVNAGNKSTLGWLLVERGVQNAPAPADAFQATKLAEKELESALEKQSRQLLENGMDLIRGDFSIMPALQRRSKKYALECERLIAAKSK